MTSGPGMCGMGNELHQRDSAALGCAPPHCTAPLRPPLRTCLARRATTPGAFLSAIAFSSTHSCTAGREEGAASQAVTELVPLAQQQLLCSIRRCWPGRTSSTA